MIVSFKDIGFDAYGNAERPVLKLKTLGGKVITTIGNYISLSPTFRLNDISEFTFDVPIVGENDVATPNYDYITGNKLIEIGAFGDFLLIAADESGDGIERKKSCKAYSLEYNFNFKKLYIPDGTYCFWNPASPNDTILSIILEKMPDWNVGTVDATLIGRYRTFDTVESNVYEFMMNTLQTTYNCLFVFDTIDKKINVIDVSKDVPTLPIYMSYDNIVKEVDISDLSDEVVTALAGYGADDLSIRTVNPNGTDYIYNLDYFINKNELPVDLAAKWALYKQNIEYYQPLFMNLYIDLRAKTALYLAEQTKLIEYQNDYTAHQKALTGTEANTATYKQLKKEMDELEKTKIPAQKKAASDAYENYEAANEAILNVKSICSLGAVFTKDDLARLNIYFREDSITEESFVQANYRSVGTDDVTFTLETDAVMTITGNGEDIKVLNMATVDKDELEEKGVDPDSIKVVVDSYNQSVKKDLYEAKGGVLSLADADGNILSGDIETIYLQINKSNLLDGLTADDSEMLKVKYYIATAVLHNVVYKQMIYESVNVTISGQLTAIPTLSNDKLQLNLASTNAYITASLTEYQKFAVCQELYDYTAECLVKLAEPSYEYTISAANYLFSPIFKQFTNNTELGKAIILEIDEDKRLYPMIIEMQFDYDDPTSLSLTISGKFRSSSSQSALSDILGQSITTSHSVDLNKYSYTSYETSGASSEVADLIKGAFDLSKRSIINSTNQSVEWNAAGLYLRKANGTGGVDPEQVAMINNMIAFTNDNWDTVKTAIGNVDGNWGIVAENVLGTLIAGENLVITNTNTNGELSFKVDQSGAWLNNCAMILAGANNRMLLDPRWGLAMGNSQLFTNADGTTVIVPNFMDDSGKLVFEDTWCNGLVPKNSHFYMDINSGDVYMSGTIYATEGYFAGEIQANTGKIGGLSIDTSGIHGNGIDISTSGIGTGGITLGNGKFALGDNLKYESGILNVDGNIKCKSLDCTNATVTGLTVGGNVAMGDNVTISWSKVSDTPTIPSKVSQLTNDSGYVDSSAATVITNNAISTAKISCNQLTAGVVGKLPTDDPEDGESFLDLSNSSGLTLGVGLNHIEFTNRSIEISNNGNPLIIKGDLEVRDLGPSSEVQVLIDGDITVKNAIYYTGATKASMESTKKRVVCIGTESNRLYYVDLNTAIDQINGSGGVAVFG